MDILEKVHELGKEIEKDERIIKYRQAKVNHDNDTELQALIGEFNLLKMNLMNEGQKENPDNDKIQKVQTDLQDCYNKIMNNQTMLDFTNISKEVENLISEINKIITYYITGEEPDNCTHDCSTCGGCH